MSTVHEHSAEDLCELPAIEDDPLVGLFSGAPDLAERTEEILAQEITNDSGWTWKIRDGAEELDSLLLAHHPRFLQLLEEARQCVRTTGGLSLAEFKQKLAEHYASRPAEAIELES